MNKKSSKKCYVFHKHKSFNEDDNEEDRDPKNPSRKGKGVSEDHSVPSDHEESSVSNGPHSCSH
jgi:hypothetical protein